MKLYKLTNKFDETHGKTQWGEGVSHSGTGKGELCSEGWVHAYTHPLLAVLLNPIHANFDSPHLWEAEGEIALSDKGLKVGCKILTTIKRIPLPEITAEQRVRFAIFCALEVYDDKNFRKWADDWLSGKDRSEDAAARAAEAAERAARAAERAAEWAAWAAARAAGAAWAAARAAGAARDAARAARATAAYAAYAARAARATAYAAAYAARAAWGKDIDLIAIAERAASH